MQGGMKFYRGSAAAARAYVEAEHSRADDYYLAEGSGVATRFVAEVSDSVSLTRGAELDGQSYERWVAGYDIETGAAKGRLRDGPKALRFVEVTVNGPKTWSLAAALYPEVSAALDAAQDRAAGQNIGWVAEHATNHHGGKHSEASQRQVEGAVPRRVRQGALAALRPQDRRPAMAGPGHLDGGHRHVRRSPGRSGHVRGVLRRMVGPPGLGPGHRAGDVAGGKIRALRGEADEADPAIRRRTWIKQMNAAGLAPGTIKTRHVNVRSVFRAAVKDRVIGSDPTDAVCLPRGRRADVAMSIPTPEEVGQLIAVADERFQPFSPSARSPACDSARRPAYSSATSTPSAGR